MQSIIGGLAGSAITAPYKVGAMHPRLGTAMQLGYVVTDIERAMSIWMERFSVGPFIHMESIGAAERTYLGRPTDVEVRVAFAYAGTMQIELIEQKNIAPSPYSDFLATGCSGFHHIAFWPNDHSEVIHDLVARGFNLVFQSRSPTDRVGIVYLQAPADIGHMLELVPVTDRRRRVYEEICGFSRSWDGTPRVHRYKSITQFAAERNLT